MITEIYEKLIVYCSFLSEYLNRGRRLRFDNDIGINKGLFASKNLEYLSEFKLIM